MQNILLVGGVFDSDGGRESGYITKLGEALAGDEVKTCVINGGHYDILAATILSISKVTHILWFADIPNELPKLLSDLQTRFSSAVLVQSKNNRLGKYSREDLLDRMQASRSELLVEFTNQDDKLAATLLTITGKTRVENTIDINVLADALKLEFQRIDELYFPFTRSITVPIGNHGGAFGVVRKNHIHEGVDLYAPADNNVYALESGVVVGIFPFTGKAAGSDWWHDTDCVMIEGDSGVLNYGEIKVDKHLSTGAKVYAGQLVGTVVTVLKNNKGKPMSMLHFERYVAGTTSPIKEWSLNTKQPSQLCDPTMLLSRALINDMR